MKNFLLALLLCGPFCITAAIADEDIDRAAVVNMVQAFFDVMTDRDVMVLIIAIEALGHTVYPVPDGLDLTNPEVLKAYIMDAPIAALLLGLGAWLVAALVGGLLACFIAPAAWDHLL